MKTTKFERSLTLDLLANSLGMSDSPFVEYDEKEEILEVLTCDFNSLELKSQKVLDYIQGLRNMAVKYYSGCIQLERSQGEFVNWNNVEMYERSRSKITCVLDEMLIYKRRP